MSPLDEREIDDEVIMKVMTLAVQFASLQESEEFCHDMNEYFDSWEGYTRIRNELERFFHNNRNLERIIHQEASRIYIDYSYNLAIKRFCAKIGG